MKIVSMSRMTVMAIALPGLLLVDGCASFNARPSPVRNASSDIKAATEYPFAAAMKDTASAVDADSRRAVRDTYIILQKRAIDARYRAFLTGLAQQSRGTNLVLDIATLGLTGGSSFAAEKTAHILSAGATAVVGGRAAFNKDLFYERTLPALVDEMNAARTAAQAAITSGLGKAADQYTLAMADIDLARYQDAADLDSALQQLTASAADHVNTADALYTAEFKACLPKPEVYLPRGKMVAYLNTLDTPAGTPALQKIADGLNLKATNATSAGLIDAIKQYISVKVCDLATAKATAESWDPSILK